MAIAVNGFAAFAVVSLTGALAVGCTEDSPKSVKTSLSGRSFHAVGAAGIALPVGSDLQLSFDGLGVRMSGGCNTGSGDYDVVDSLLIVDEMALTEMACEPPLMELDAVVVSLLTGRPRVELDGDRLTITGGPVTLRLVDDGPDPPDRTLDNTLWVVSSVVHLDSVESDFGDARATVRFTGESADVMGGCNSGSVTYAAGDTSIEFGVLGLTKMACPQRTMELEFMVALVLQGTASYRIDGNQLTLLNGEYGLVLDAAANA